MKKFFKNYLDIIAKADIFRVSPAVKTKGSTTMKAKKVYLHETDKVNAIIAKVEGKATARTITAEDVQKWVTGWQKQVGHVSKKNLKGVLLNCTYGAKMPSGYKWSSQETDCTVVHDGKGWVFKSASRNTCRHQSGGGRGPNVYAHLTDDARQAVLENMCKY